LRSETLALSVFERNVFLMTMPALPPARSHELSDLYEAKIRSMGNAGRNGGEYYKPRPLIRAMLALVKPRIGETIYDGALGSAGFLCESFERLKEEAKNVANRKNYRPAPFTARRRSPLPT
jgi:type I restriction enzyme M protein